MSHKAILTAACLGLLLVAVSVGAAPSPAAAPELTVDFPRIQYVCEQRAYDYEVAPGVTWSLDGYRSLQLDAYITNRSNKPLELVMKPARWIITDGTKDVISDLAWEWTKVQRNVKLPTGQRVPQIVDQIGQWHADGKTVTLQPGQSVPWSFVAFPLGKGEWVKGVDFVWNGKTYHKDLDLGPYGNAYNYGQDCGFWAPSADAKPTPTPGPEARALGAAVAVPTVAPRLPAKAAAPVSKPAPAAAAPELALDIARMRYVCEQRAYDYEVAPGVTWALHGYRSFQIDANITNRSDKPVELLMKPARWIITDGTKDVISDLAWEWTKATKGNVMVRGTPVPNIVDQIGQWNADGKDVTLQPGQRVAWSFIAFPLDKGEWVKGVDFVWNGKTYHKDFDLGPYGNAYNYGQDCGFWAPGADFKPTPTPGPEARALGAPAAAPQPSPTSRGAAARAAVPARPAGRDLDVSFVNSHYECVNGTWEYETASGVTDRLWGYRSFQTDMYITNHGNAPVMPPWSPKRWIITDGTKDVINDVSWYWVNDGTGLKVKPFPQQGLDQPAIGPGQSAGWTFVAFPLEPGQWVKGVDFVWNGQTYHQDLDIGPYRTAYGYDKDCGIPNSQVAHDPTPTPRP